MKTTGQTSESELSENSIPSRLDTEATVQRGNSATEVFGCGCLYLIAQNICFTAISLYAQIALLLYSIRITPIVSYLTGIDAVGKVNQEQKKFAGVQFEVKSQPVCTAIRNKLINMGNGLCSRKQKKIFQFLLLITVIFGLVYGVIFSYEMHKQLKRTEAMAVKYQQHQESLSAQLQVVYEHRSRLEKYLQREKQDHKKSKEDYLVYKLEAQQTLNKEKQDGSNRYNSLHAQHQTLTNQHDDLKKQFFHLQDVHQVQKVDHSKALDEHREMYHQLQQAKELEISKFKENMYNLMGENKQLRKAHQDIHVQLQDVRQQHKDLQSSHKQLALTLEDHKSALAASQLQVDEYKQLKEKLNKIPSLQQVGQDAPNPPQPAAVKADVHTKVQPRVGEAQGHDPKAAVEPKAQPVVVPQRAAQPEVQAAQGPGPGPEEGGAQEEERRRELAEEEMEQAGQPQRLEDSEQPQEEEGEEEEEEGEQDQPDENALDRDRQEGAQRPAQEPRPDAQREPAVQREALKSPYEQQLEQQRLAAQMAEERRQLLVRQQALQQQRLQDQRDRELLLRSQREKEMQQHREADRKEQLLREHQLRQRNQYENLDADIVHGNEDPQKEEEEVRNPQMHLKQGQEKQEERGIKRERNLAEEEMNPEDDPNNQGEDEFEEAQEQRGEGGQRQTQTDP
ncbi:hypothetical protein AAFF_G00187100 [Aldrovandia affinis]|uniref:Golgi integral membrane protein 4 n=1 Tax=Aldrovandia affinis TaxID=143900 RepID=A0AAD7SXZ8_9TELE|nr:hypothetical protein AAFF_G00187100 [Aldrovandia affinis]